MNPRQLADGLIFHNTERPHHALGLVLPGDHPSSFNINRSAQGDGRIQRVDKTIQVSDNHPQRLSRGDEVPAEKHDKSTLRIDP